ncbi:transmembrane protein 177 [Frieseomelitta varia]|uniref:transmembrane protein 177 n=1 Tax=Frieseomelitta varia TaxID=561572 RepID=UPI001CB69B9C|nr:transmembrane protein 177 [Frieseomelitta varia]XP_043508579.1 transmembrane protein 177 [Frieseomelitta varia]XP_043508663.1 transmembrane protein 177 [Frieseomelitta varia]XP_043508747.1 transmembrane protein 177 [Frieseomelitta varia]XP_043508826.1 transmembrane protein 177 [Frieseomelitta varia]
MGILRPALVIIGASTQLLPHTYFLERYRKFRARYDFEDNEIPVREDIQRRFEEVVDDLNLSCSLKIEKERIKLFNVHDIEVFHAGSLYTKSGGVVGIPANFEYENINSITDGTISIQYPALNWDLEAIKEFHTSLVLSENAQKFAMAREILKVATFDPIYKFCNVFGDMIIAIVGYDLLYSKLNGTKQQKVIQAFCISITAIVTFFLTALTHSALDTYREKEVNEIMSKLDSKYIQGGVEYYEKLSQKNKALRVLLGTKGTYLYTPTGNQVGLFGISTKLPNSDQINYFQTRLQNISSQLV